MIGGSSALDWWEDKPSVIFATRRDFVTGVSGSTRSNTRDPNVSTAGALFIRNMSHQKRKNNPIINMELKN